MSKPDWILVTEGPFVALVAREEKRTHAGLLHNPPKLFVSAFHDEQQFFSLEPVSFAAANTLAPEAYERLGKAVDAVRNSSASE